MKSVFSIPKMAPMYEPPPYVYQGNRSVSVLFKTTPETLQAMVPAPLVPNPDSLIFVFIAQLNVVSPVQDSYMEMGIGVPVSFFGNPGQFAVCFYLDKAGAIVPGREIYGFPKKDAAITLLEDSEGITAQVVREGAMLAKISLHQLEQVDPIPAQPDLPWFNLKIIPSVQEHAQPDVMQLTATLMKSEKKALYTGSVSLKFGSSVSDPLGEIPIVEVVMGSFTVDEAILGYGDVIHDYLVERK